MKLHSYGIRSAALRWIESFPCNRRQKVVVEGEESDSVPVTSRVPQGSVLGPILFLVPPDDIVSQVCLFVDDTAISLTLKNKGENDKLQRDLDRLQTWETIDGTSFRRILTFLWKEKEEDGIWSLTHPNRGVVGFLKVVRPLNAVDVHRVPNARVGGGGGRAREGVSSLSLGGFWGPPPWKFCN